MYFEWEMIKSTIRNVRVGLMHSHGWCIIIKSKFTVSFSCNSYPYQIVLLILNTIDFEVKWFTFWCFYSKSMASMCVVYLICAFLLFIQLSKPFVRFSHCFYSFHTILTMSSCTALDFPDIISIWSAWFIYFCSYSRQNEAIPWSWHAWFKESVPLG